uniref:Uncharacterized protein n=1 Tax=Anguilla anguilla TaxID=7936 RepID=A0A0E9V048_ANGAN
MSASVKVAKGHTVQLN